VVLATRGEWESFIEVRQPAEMILFIIFSGGIGAWRYRGLLSRSEVRLVIMA